MANSCAWENLPEGGEKPPFIVEVTMRMGGDMSPDLFYYIVFNLSGEADKKPRSIITGPDRGKFWTVYYMWGTPKFQPTDLYRGFGGQPNEDTNLVDKPPVKSSFLNELLPGTVIEGNQMTLKIDLTEIQNAISNINLNMIVCDQAIDAESQLYYQFDPIVWDSFYGNGLTINLKSTTEDFYSENDTRYQMERIPNENEDIALPKANIVYWEVLVIT